MLSSHLDKYIQKDGNTMNNFDLMENGINICLIGKLLGSWSFFMRFTDPLQFIHRREDVIQKCYSLKIFPLMNSEESYMIPSYYSES